MTKFINAQPLEHRSHNGTRFIAGRCDLQDGVQVEKPGWLDDVRFAQDVAEFASWHRGEVWERLNGFAGYGCIQFNIKVRAGA